MWENWQNKDDTIAFTAGGKEGRKEGRANLVLFFALPFLCANIRCFGEKPFKVRLHADGWGRESGECSERQRAVAASALSSGSKLRQGFSFFEQSAVRRSKCGEYTRDPSFSPFSSTKLEGLLNPPPL